MSEIDPELDAKWRDASREQPPAALDNAIRAAARREVGARPGAFRTTPRWLPLAAAATVAAIAVGIVQMTPPEQVTPVERVSPGMAPSSLDAAQRNAGPDADKVMANKPQPALREAPASVVAPAVAPQARPEPAKPGSKEQARQARDVASETDRGTLARNRSDTFASPPAAQFQEKKKLAERQEAVPLAEEAIERDQRLKQKSELAAAGEGASRASQAASSTPAAARRNDLQPFPAAPPSAESVAGNAPPPAVAQAPAPMAAPAPSPAPAVAARKLAAQSSATGALSGGVDAKVAANAEPLPNQDAAALGKSAAADKVAPERKKDAAPLAPDEWIKRIRRLIAEGRTDDAAKELIAFRREYKERSESLLPSDLRSFKP